MQDGFSESADSLLEMSGNACTAAILNMLFDTRLSRWDLDYCIGRASVRVESIGQRISAGECWHNPEGSLCADVERLAALIGSKHTSGWVRTGILMAVLGGLLARIHGEEQAAFPIQLALNCGDLTAAMAAVHLRRWGFPIEKILISCSNASGIWELLYRGCLHTDAVAPISVIPDDNRIFTKELESLLYCAGGRETVKKYLDCCVVGEVFRPDAELTQTLRGMLTAVVVSRERVKRAADGLCRTNGYGMSLQTAAAYAALQDYRSLNGIYSPGLILSEQKPEV